MAKNALEQLVDTVMNSNFMDPQQGMATLAGYARGGLKDLQNAVVHAFPDSTRQTDALGMIASPTPQMVHESFTGKDGTDSGCNIDMDMSR